MTADQPFFAALPFSINDRGLPKHECVVRAQLRPEAPQPKWIDWVLPRVSSRCTAHNTQLPSPKKCSEMGDLAETLWLYTRIKGGPSYLCYKHPTLWLSCSPCPSPVGGTLVVLPAPLNMSLAGFAARGFGASERRWLQTEIFEDAPESYVQ